MSLNATSERFKIALCLIGVMADLSKFARIWCCIRETSQSRSQGLLLFQDGGWARRRPWDTLAKYSTNRGVFCHVTHDRVHCSPVVGLFKDNAEKSANINSYLFDWFLTSLREGALIIISVALVWQRYAWTLLPEFDCYSQYNALNSSSFHVTLRYYILSMIDFIQRYNNLGIENVFPLGVSKCDNIDILNWPDSKQGIVVYFFVHELFERPASLPYWVFFHQF